MALALGYFNVDAMLDSASSAMLTEWIAFHNLNPFGEGRKDFRSALIARTIAEVNRDVKKQPRPFSISDFMPKFLRRGENESKGKSAEEIKSILLEFVKEHNKAVAKKR